VSTGNKRNAHCKVKYKAKMRFQIYLFVVTQITNIDRFTSFFFFFLVTKLRIIWQGKSAFPQKLNLQYQPAHIDSHVHIK